MRICLDASFVAPLFLPEEWSGEIQSRVDRWRSGSVEFIAPALWAYEMVSLVFKAVNRGRLLPEQGRPTLSAIFGFPIALVHTPSFERAYLLALQYHLPAAYDAHYLAVAEAEGIEFWTADQRLYDRVHAALPWVHWLGEQQPGQES